MKNNLITMIFSMAVLVSILLSSKALLSDPSAYTRYYITSIVMISAMAAAISGLRLLLTLRRHPPSSRLVSKESQDQPREHFRLTFDQHPPPLFVAGTDPDLPADALTCPVGDLSETGITLLCTGVYSTGQTVHGEVIFASGRTAQINGRVVREDSDRTCLSLHCTIDPSVFMAEQRELIESQKRSGPRPAVSTGALEKPGASLPSHRPKGICRLK